MSHMIFIPIYLILEALYMTWNHSYFKEFFNHVQRSPIVVRKEAVVACYLVLLGILYVFIIKPRRTPLYAALLGFCVYAVYDLTNYATLTRWTPMMVLMDVMWGTVAFGLTAWLTYKLE